MTESSANTTTQEANEFLTKKYAGQIVSIHSVEGGYSRNRRAIIELKDRAIFAKEVDVDLLPDEGMTELTWLKKDYEVTQVLRAHGIDIVPEWCELDMNGHLLLMTSYEKKDGWWWSLPNLEQTRTTYIDTVIQATKQLEALHLPKEYTPKLSLQPFFRDEIAGYDGMKRLLEDADLRQRLVEKYKNLLTAKPQKHLEDAYLVMMETLHHTPRLEELQTKTLALTKQPNHFFNHCDVRSDNIAFNENTNEIKIVDWNWASYAPAGFGATEFLLDMARRGVDITRWKDELNIELLAATVGYYIIRSLKDPLTPDNNLREMQAQTAAIANYLYTRL
jgi:hypothetical protein